MTGVRGSGPARGFWFQDAEPDADPRTSEGLFVSTGNQIPAVAIGDAVAVGGRVAEYYPIAEGETPETTPNQSVTELVEATWQVTGKGGVPIEAVGPETVPSELAPQDGAIDKRELEPQRFALDYYESREGMLLRVDNARSSADRRVPGAVDHQQAG